MSDAFAPGQVIAGKYAIQRVLGEGGMGVVVLARHVHLEHDVALKFLRTEAISSQESVSRFLTEARAAARIQSEHVVRVLDVATLDDGTPYIVMEFVAGRDLDATLRRGLAKTPEARFASCVELGEEVARAIENESSPRRASSLADDRLPIGAGPRPMLTPPTGILSLERTPLSSRAAMVERVKTEIATVASSSTPSGDTPRPSIFIRKRTHRFQNIAVALAVITIALSWTLVHTTFALHYAHEYYRGRKPGGLQFPSGDTRDHADYWDFVYFSFVIGMTAQVSDVGITDKIIRRTATVHGIISFVFNTALLALMVPLLGGQIDLMFISLVTGSEQVRAGKLRAYGVTSDKRQAVFPDLPAIGEVVPGFESTAWFGVFAPAHLPDAITEKLHTTIVGALKEPRLREQLKIEGAIAVGNTPKEFTAFVREDIERWAPVVKASGAKPN